MKVDPKLRAATTARVAAIMFAGMMILREGIVVPEPCSPALLLLGGGFLLRARRKLPFK